MLNDNILLTLVGKQNKMKESIERYWVYENGGGGLKKGMNGSSF